MKVWYVMCNISSRMVLVHTDYMPANEISLAECSEHLIIHVCCYLFVGWKKNKSLMFGGEVYPSSTVIEEFSGRRRLGNIAHNIIK